MAQGGERDRPEGDRGMEEERKTGRRTGLKAGAATITTEGPLSSSSLALFL